MSVRVIKSNFYAQAELLLSVLPIVMEEKVFALKGGTAINLFVRNMPRLSVDIDLTYVPIEERSKSLLAMEMALMRIKNRLQKLDSSCHIQEKRLQINNRLVKLFVRKNNAGIKIEPNEVLRGIVYPCKSYKLSEAAEKVFGISIADVSVLSFADLYGGKICAALDRQHPRDLFDVKLLLENEGINNHIRLAFVVYLASSSGAMHELLDPKLINIDGVFFNEFQGMTNVPVTLDEILHTRQQLLKTIHSELTEKERLFLLSFKQGDPNWHLIELPHVQQLPAIQWKLQNIQKMGHYKRKLMMEKLKKVLCL